jgi:hypothetical protein
VPFPVPPSLVVIYPLHLALPLPRWFLLYLPLMRRAIALCVCSWLPYSSLPKLWIWIIFPIEHTAWSALLFVLHFMLTMTVRMTNNIRIQDTSATHVVTANLIMEVSVSF